MVRTGEVVESDSGKVTVVFERPAACDNCNGCLHKQCTNVELDGAAAVGDEVDVAMPEKNVVGASAIAYIIPLALLIAGLLLGGPLHGALGIDWSRDLFSALLGGVLLGIGLLVVHLIDRRLRGRQDWQPRIVAVHPANEKAQS